MDEKKSTAAPNAAPVEQAAAPLIRMPVEKNGRWVIQEVPPVKAEEMSEKILDVIERDDRYDTPIDLGPEWHDRRGQEFHAFLAHSEPKHRTEQARLNYKPVDPAEFKDHRGQISTKVAGFEGIPVIVYGNELVLMETPRRVWEYRTERDRERALREHEERTKNRIAEANDTLASKSGGQVRLREERGGAQTAEHIESDGSHRTIPFNVHGKGTREQVLQASMELAARQGDYAVEELKRQVAVGESFHGGFQKATFLRGPGKLNFGYVAPDRQ